MRNLPSIVALAAAIGLSTIAAQSAQAAKPPIYTGTFSRVAVGGYDAVSYFDSGAPVQGRKDLTFQYKGAEFRFASVEHQSRFAMAPDDFAPQYGGYCAWAVAQGYTASGDPLVFKIVDGKLYLNYDRDVASKWLSDIPGFIKAADANWPGVLGK